MKLTPHFSLGEMTKSQTALRLGLDNNPDPDGVASLRTLCWQVLEPVRKHFDRPVIINSGYRAEAVNTAIGSKPTSQLILEYYTGEPQSGWVHVSYVSHDTNRRERLRIDKAGVRRD